MLGALERGFKIPAPTDPTSYGSNYREAKDGLGLV